MAVFPNDSGYTNYSSDATNKFIPEIWSGKLQVKFYKSTVLSAITNNDWEGEIKGGGDKVRIRVSPNVTIRDYKRGLTLTTEVPDSTAVELQIDKGKYFAVVMDDVNAVQSDVKLMDMFTTDAAEQMKIAIDTDVLANVGASVAAANSGATAGAISGSINLGKTGAAVQLASNTVLDFILNMGLVLDEQNIPETGRFLVMPPWMAMMLKQSDLKAAYLTGDPTSPLRNGKVGMVDRFTVYTSQLLPTATDVAGTTGSTSDTAFYVLAGTQHGITFASQITKVETLRSTSTFGNIVRGLNVYGYDVIKPEALALGYVYK